MLVAQARGASWTHCGGISDMPRDFIGGAVSAQRVDRISLRRIGR
jgi:hypothetical protein